MIIHYLHCGSNCMYMVGCTIGCGTISSCQSSAISKTASAVNQLITYVRRLRSADTRTLISWTCSSFGDRTFAAVGPQVWNSLPPNLNGQFRWLLKTFLLDTEATAQCELFLTVPNRNILTYLLNPMKFSHR